MIDLFSLPSCSVNTKTLVNAMLMHELNAKETVEILFAAAIAKRAGVRVEFEGWKEPNFPNPEDSGNSYGTYVLLKICLRSSGVGVRVGWNDICQFLEPDLPAREER
jgi:hypothetical protein